MGSQHGTEQAPRPRVRARKNSTSARSLPSLGFTEAIQRDPSPSESRPHHFKGSQRAAPPPRAAKGSQHGTEQAPQHTGDVRKTSTSAHLLASPPPGTGRPLLGAVGARIRNLRRELRRSRRELAAQTGLSERFLAQVETGEGNPSVLSLAQIATALGTTAASLLTVSDHPPVVALLGLRGAGKSTVGRALAAKLGAPFIELDARVEEAAGLTVREIFELHGEEYYRRFEREALESVLAETGEYSGPGADQGGQRHEPTREQQLRANLATGGGVVSHRTILATGGGIVSHRESFETLRRGATTIWLKATPEEHWNRVVAQGDHRPMANDPLAMSHLRELLTRREGLYREADHIIETSGRSIGEIVERILAAIARDAKAGPSPGS